MSVEFEVIDLKIPEGCNIIVGQAHFIKAVEDIYEALITSCPGIEFGVAFCEASGDRLVRIEGNNKDLIEAASENVLKIAAGHCFVIILKNAWPINVLNALKNIQEITCIYAATANPLQVVVAKTKQGRGIVSVIDGFIPVGIEKKEDVEKRRRFLREVVKYKF